MEISNLKTQRINQNDYHKNIFTRNKIGALYTFPKRFTPEDCLACDGYVLKIIDFSELYEIIGTTFNSGTEADDEFRIPDYNLTGRFLQPGNKNLGTTKNAGIPSIKLALSKSFIDKMFDMMMPKGAKNLTLSKMNMGGLGSAMMKWIMKNKNISTLSELITQAQKNGIKFIACNMSMDVMGIKKEELLEGVEIGGVAKYISESNNANSNLFI